VDTDLIGGRYRLDGELGSGGMGIVWRAYDELLARPVAVKEIRFPAHTSAREHAELTARAMTEARAAAALTHPAIVAVYDVTTHDDRPWIIMQLVPGRSLQQVVAEDGPLNHEEAARLSLRLLDALDTAHAAGVMHRDVKPSNVLMPGGGATAMLTDFSIAKVMGYGTTNTDMPVGSAGYIAPERMLTGVTGFEGDLFGLGATLFFALEGTGPFHRPDPMMAILAAAVEPHPRPQRAGPHTALLDALLIKDPRQRATLSQARNILLGTSTADPPTPTSSPPTPAPSPAPSPTPLTTPGPPPAPQASPPTPASPPAPQASAPTPASPPAPHALPAHGLGVPPAGADDPPTLRVPPWNQAQRQAGFTRGRAGVPTPESAPRILNDPAAADAEPPRRRRSRRGLLFTGAGVAAGAVIGGTAWALRNAKRGRQTPDPGPRFTQSSNVDVLSGHKDEVWSVAWAPDSQRLASASADFTVRLWLATSAESTRVLTGHSGEVYSVAWASDGARLATAAADNSARIWDAQAGVVTRTLPHEQPVRSVSWSPDGRYLATGCNDRKIRIWDAESGNLLRTLVGHTTAALAVAWSPNGRALASIGDLGDEAANLMGYVIAARVWDPFTGKETMTVTTGKPPGAPVPPRSSPRTSLLWNGIAAALRVNKTPETTSVAWSPDSALLATGNTARTTWLWDAQTGEQLRVLTGHTEIVNAVAFKPTEVMLVTASADWTMLLWNPESGTILRTFKGHTGSVNTLAFSPDGKRLASGSSDKTLRLWTPVA
jgi:WD40 repeat protein/serine/threonine protein kinase